MPRINETPFVYNPMLEYAVDIEMWDQDKARLHIPHGEFASISICHGEDVWVICSLEEAAPIVQNLFRNNPLIFQNGQYDIVQLRGLIPNLPIPSRIWDIMIADQGLWGGYYGKFGLGDLANRWLTKYLPKDDREKFYKGTKRKPVVKEMTPELIQYSGDDAWTTYQIKQAQVQYIYENQIPYQHILTDFAMIPVVLEMLPIRLDREIWLSVGKQFEDWLRWKEANSPYNINSPNQVRDYLNARLHGKKLSSTEATILTGIIDNMRDDDPLKVEMEEIIKYRSIGHIASTYGENWYEKGWVVDDHILGGWQICEAATGRMSCRSPNLQNIPVREYPEYRTAFVADEGSIIIVVDVVQQEPRILAKLSEDETLNGALQREEDLHSNVAITIYNDPSISKGDPRRKVGKAINLGLSYGLTAKGLSERIDKTEEECIEIMNLYFAKYPGVKDYIQSYRREAITRGYVSTPSGRRYFINPYTYTWKNNAINSPIQGGAADWMKLAAVTLYRKCKERDIPFCLSLVVHDEMVCMVPKELEQVYSDLLREVWEESGSIIIPGVPVKVDLEIGTSWGVKG